MILNRGEKGEDLLTETPDDVPIAMLPFSTTVRDIFDFSPGRTAIVKWLKEGPGLRPKLKHRFHTALPMPFLRR